MCCRYAVASSDGDLLGREKADSVAALVGCEILYDAPIRNSLGIFAPTLASCEYHYQILRNGCPDVAKRWERNSVVKGDDSRQLYLSVFELCRIDMMLANLLLQADKQICWHTRLCKYSTRQLNLEELTSTKLSTTL